MQPDVSLKSIELKGAFNTIAGVRCNLSNRQSSPMFEKEGSFNINPKTFAFDTNRPIKAVEASSVNKGYTGNMHGIRFLDGAGAEVFF